MNKHIVLPALTALATLAVRAQTPIAADHVDIGIGYEVGGFNLHIHQEEPIDQEFAPSEAYFVIGSAAAAVSPGGSYTGFLGVAGSQVWILPTVQHPELPFLGFGTEELDPADWLGNIDLTLTAVNGPGEFSIWSVNAFGTPNLRMGTADGINASDRLTLIPGSHGHFNLGFTAPGTYEVTVQATGSHVSDGFQTSDPATYRFEVVPEPSTWVMLGLGASALLFVARRSPR